MARPTSLKSAENFSEQDPSSTKERLLQVAQALFAQKGFHATSTREITRQAKTNVEMPVVYRACLDRDRDRLSGEFGAPEPGHASDHGMARQGIH